jgi:hypothetical protein
MHRARPIHELTLEEKSMSAATLVEWLEAIAHLGIGVVRLIALSIGR